jgi:light-regulated signal transduction histidine kinase (bacteriophytochrome)
MGKLIRASTLFDDQYHCHMRFADNAIGFEKKYNEKIFVVCQRLRSKDEHTGTGIFDIYIPA